MKKLVQRIRQVKFIQNNLEGVQERKKWNCRFGITSSVISFFVLLASFALMSTWVVCSMRMKGVTFLMRGTAAAAILLWFSQVVQVVWAFALLTHKDVKFRTLTHCINGVAGDTYAEIFLAFCFTLVVFPHQALDENMNKFFLTDSFVDNVYFHVIPSMMSKAFFVRIMFNMFTVMFADLYMKSVIEEELKTAQIAADIAQVDDKSNDSTKTEGEVTEVEEEEHIKVVETPSQTKVEVHQEEMKRRFVPPTGSLASFVRSNPPPPPPPSPHALKPRWSPRSLFRSPPDLQVRHPQIIRHPHNSQVYRSVRPGVHRFAVRPTVQRLPQFMHVSTGLPDKPTVLSGIINDQPKTIHSSSSGSPDYVAEPSEKSEEESPKSSNKSSGASTVSGQLHSSSKSPDSHESGKTFTRSRSPSPQAHSVKTVTISASEAKTEPIDDDDLDDDDDEEVRSS